MKIKIMLYLTPPNSKTENLWFPSASCKPLSDVHLHTYIYCYLKPNKMPKICMKKLYIYIHTCIIYVEISDGNKQQIY